MVESNLAVMTSDEKLDLITISRDVALLKIQANQNDPITFQTFFCTGCQTFVLASGFFPTPEQHAMQPGHRLAWLPAVDEPLHGQPYQAIQYWLATAPLSQERRDYLTQIAPTVNSMCWGLLIDPAEREEWLDFLADYLDGLAEAWLTALNGEDTRYFRSSEMWFHPRPDHQFNWTNTELAEE